MQKFENREAMAEFLVDQCLQGSDASLSLDFAALTSTDGSSPVDIIEEVMRLGPKPLGSVKLETALLTGYREFKGAPIMICDSGQGAPLIGIPVFIVPSLGDSTMIIYSRTWNADVGSLIGAVLFERTEKGPADLLLDYPKQIKRR